MILMSLLLPLINDELTDSRYFVNSNKLVTTCLPRTIMPVFSWFLMFRSYFNSREARGPSKRLLNHKFGSYYFGGFLDILDTFTRNNPWIS